MYFKNCGGTPVPIESCIETNVFFRQQQSHPAAQTGHSDESVSVKQGVPATGGSASRGTGSVRRGLLVVRPGGRNVLLAFGEGGSKCAMCTVPLPPRLSGLTGPLPGPHTLWQSPVTEPLPQGGWQLLDAVHATHLI